MVAMTRLEELRLLMGQIRKYPKADLLPPYFEAVAHDGLVTGLVTAADIAQLLDDDEKAEIDARRF